MCKKDPDCLNSKIIVLDTNFLDQINRTVKEEIAFYMLGKPINEQKIPFLEKTREVLGWVGNCGNGLVFTSAKVYDDEIDVKKIESDIRKADMTFLDSLCMEEEFANSLSGIYQDIIKIEPIENDDVRIFQELLSENVGLADTSLVLLALTLSQNNEVIIITDDLSLREVIENLKKARQLKIEGKSLSTENLYYFGSLHFLKSLHTCCEASNRLWMSTLISFVRHQEKRCNERKISRIKFEEHKKYSKFCFEQCMTDCDAKKEREEIKQISEMFGIKNEGQN